MKKILVVTKVRGFWKDLFDYESSNLKFIYEESQNYEIPHKWREMLSLIVSSRFLDFTGIFQIRKYDYKIKSDYAFSYNRFLCSDRPYVIALENPTALVNYSFKRMYYPLTKVRLKKCFKDSNLVGIICISKACEKNIKKYYQIPDTVQIRQIYPLIKAKIDIPVEHYIEYKHEDGKLKCLYVAAYFELKGGADVIYAFEKLKDYNIELIIITKLETISTKYKNMIEKNPNIKLLDYKLNKEELYNIYAISNILINPTRKDSFSLVTLEAVKHGCAVLSTDNYALKELVLDDINGYKISPKYCYWTIDDMPNYEIVYHQKKTIDSEYVDDKIVEFIYEKLMFLYNDSEKLKELENNSINLFNSGEFSSEYIIAQWDDLLFAK